MKKVFLSIGLITNLLNYTNAQIQKGSWLLDGGLHYNQETCDDYSFGSSSRTDMTNKHLDGTVGYFLSDKLALGVSAGVDAFNRNYVTSYLGRINVSEFSQQNYHVSPFARYYFNPKSKFKTFYELSIGGNWDRSESTYFTFGTTPSVGDNANFFQRCRNSWCRAK